LLVLPGPGVGVTADPWLSAGRQPDPMAKTLSEIRQSERRKIPIEVFLKAAEEFKVGDPVEVTVIVTNLFDPTLLMNRRMLVNHPRLQGEIAFRIQGPDGKPCEIKRLITPLAMRDEDFVQLRRGQSIQRTVDLADLFGLRDSGTYNVRVSYRNEVDQTMEGLRAWKGIAWSDPVELRLVR
jgi:hypothetical protein